MEGAYTSFLIASPYSSAASATSGSNEYPSPAWPMSSSAVRPIQPTMSTSLEPSPVLLTRAEIAVRSYTEVW